LQYWIIFWLILLRLLDSAHFSLLDFLEDLYSKFQHPKVMNRQQRREKLMFGRPQNPQVEL